MQPGADVVIADDHPLFRNALAGILRALPGIANVHMAANGKEALLLAQRHKPVLAILDLAMPEMNGLKTMAEMQRLCPDVKLMVLSLRSDTESVRLSLQAGARAYLPKEADLDEIETAVCAVLDGEVYLPSRLAQKMAMDQLYVHGSNQLTDRERQVLQLMGKQFTTTQIASSLQISVRTVERLRSNIMTKTGSTTSAGALLFAERNGLLPEPV